MTIGTTRSPAGPLTAYADAADLYPMNDGQFLQPRGQDEGGLRAKLTLLLRRKRGRIDPGPLPLHPVHMAFDERIGFPPRPATRDGDAYTPVEIDAEEITACAAMPDEVDGIDLARGRGRLLSRLAERKPQLHVDRILDVDAGGQRPRPLGPQRKLETR